jgi:hypothetical protein
MTKREITLSITSIILITSSIYLRFYFIENPDRIISKKENLEVLIEASKKIKKIWHEGDLRDQLKNKKLNCVQEFKELGQVDSSFLRCNLRFLECVLRESLDKVIIDFPKNIYPIKQEKNLFTKWVSRSTMEGPKLPNYGVMVNLGYGGDSLKIILEDSCHQSVIPQRVYSYGPENVDWRWDNLNRIILIDKNLVTNNDVLNVNPDFKFRNLSFPATELSQREMEKFCLSKGMQIAQAHVFDAATFFPGDLRNKNPQRFFKSPYPWTRVKMNSFLYSAQRYNDFVFEKKYCNQVFSSECVKLVPFEDFQFNATSWLGLSSILGGPMEYMRNPVESNENLLASSYHYPITSNYHQLGKRAFWDGLGHTWENFTLEERPLNEKGEIGFRCMRVIPNVN